MNAPIRYIPSASAIVGSNRSIYENCLEEMEIFPQEIISLTLSYVLFLVNVGDSLATVKSEGDQRPRRGIGMVRKINHGQLFLHYESDGREYDWYKEDDTESLRYIGETTTKKYEIGALVSFIASTEQFLSGRVVERRGDLILVSGLGHTEWLLELDPNLQHAKHYPGPTVEEVD